MAETAETATVDDIIELVTGLVGTELGVELADLDPDLDLGTVEGANSVKVLRVVAKIERNYDIELEDDQVFGFKTIRDVATAVAGHLAERAAP